MEILLKNYMEILNGVGCKVIINDFEGTISGVNCEGKLEVF